MGINLAPEERFEVFGDLNPDQHAAEVRSAGAKPMLIASRRRASRYTKADWERMKAEAGEPVKQSWRP